MKLYIWGTGRLAGNVVGRYIDKDSIVAFVDNNPDKNEFIGKKVFRPEILCNREYDAIIVATMYAKEIKAQCEKLNIPKEKIIYLYNNLEFEDMNKDYSFINRVLGDKLSRIIKNRYHLVRELENERRFEFDNSAIKQDYFETDYVRIKNFELVVCEIVNNNVKGNIAEVGVFKGEFSQYINSAFPERKLYLFDTFEGFNENEAKRELNDGNCTEAFVQTYSNTSIEEVLKRMRFPENVVIKQGYFPDSLDGLEDTFAFVSIDVDFEDSIYECLKYFYPRMLPGAYAFIHDYNSELRGVSKAVERYEEEYGKIHKVPICDACGTLVITK